MLYNIDIIDEGGLSMQVIIALIGAVATALLIWYVYILMKGDEQK